MAATSRTRRLALLSLVLLSAAAGLWVLWQRTAELPLAAGFVAGNGRLEATAYDVATKMAGRLATLVPREGERVRAGEEVGTIDARDLEAQLAQAEAQVEQARQAAAEARATVVRYDSELGLARANFVRTRELVNRKFISDQRLDQDRNTVRTAEAALAAARVRVEAADAAVVAAEAGGARIRCNLEDARLAAPISGRVLYRLVEPGTVLASGARVLTLLDLEDVYLTVFLPAETAGRIPLGAEARIRVDALPDELLPATVSFVAERAQFTPREVETRSEREKLMFRVKLQVDPEWLAARREVVKPGMPAVGFVRLDPTQPWPPVLPPR